VTKSGIILTGIIFYIFGVILIVATLFGIRKKTKSKLEKQLYDLEIKKNNIINASILTELKKVESLINNKNMEVLYENWKKEFNAINENKIPKLTDELLDIETLLVDNDFKEANFLLAKVELDIEIVQNEVVILLSKIREITMSEERNRESVTKLKTIYRSAINKFNKNKNEYKDLINPIELQIENINKLFATFESAMERSEYDNVSKIVKALDDLIKNILVVIDEAPTIILLGKIVIPKKISDIKGIYTKLKKSGYNLDYLNLDYNIDETNKKISDIFDRLNVLNLENSIFDLKTMLDYFERIFSDFDKEKIGKKNYESNIAFLNEKINRLNLVVKNIYIEIDKLKDTYALKNEELNVIDEIRKQIISIKDEFKLMSDRTRTKTTPYSKLSSECENLNVKLNKIEDDVESAIKSLSSLKEDELRAREELTEIRKIINDAKIKINSYKLPVIPKKFYIELEESADALKEIVKELGKLPISIETLNTRVDTGRDLSFKVYNTANECIKTCAMSEMAIVYANRYRSSYKEVESGILKSEKEFFKGEYKKSLETILNILNSVEPGIYEKLMKAYEK